MPDISMCTNTDCPSRGKCYRYLARPSDPWQTYSKFEVTDGADRCDSFWDAKGRHVRTLEEADAERAGKERTF